MNERIDELIEECTLVNDDLVYDGRDSYMKTTEYFDKEKFAKLIVRECSRVAKLSEADDGDDYKSGRAWAGIEVLKHFGVEE